MNAKAVREMVHIQQRMIRRGARYWIEAADRLQNGELAPSAWIESWASLFADSRRDAAEGFQVWRRAQDVDDAIGNDQVTVVGEGDD